MGYAEGALLSRQLGGWQVIRWALVLAAPLTWAVSIVAATRTGLHATGPQWAAFGYTTVFSMFLGFFAWYAGMARAGIAKASQIQLAQPALAMVWGWALLGEHLSPAAVITHRRMRWPSAAPPSCGQHDRFRSPCQMQH